MQTVYKMNVTLQSNALLEEHQTGLILIINYDHKQAVAPKT